MNIGNGLVQGHGQHWCGTSSRALRTGSPSPSFTGKCPTRAARARRMMIRRDIVTTVAVLALLLSGQRSWGQAPSALGTPVGCTYATCALRIETAWFGMHVVRGTQGERVGRLGSFGGGVESLLSGPDSAAAYGRQYVRATRRSSTLGLIGAVAYAVVVVRTDNFKREQFGDAEVITAIAGAGLTLASVPFAVQAQRSLSRAVWWYNSALPR